MNRPASLTAPHRTREQINHVESSAGSSIRRIWRASRPALGDTPAATIGRDYAVCGLGSYERCSCLSPSDYRARVIAHDEGARRGAPRPCRRSGVRLTA